MESPQFSYYSYNPTQVGAIIFIVLFGILILWQTFQCVQSFMRVHNHKKSSVTKDLENPFDQDTKIKVSSRYIYILIPFYIGLFCEFIGFIARSISHDNIFDRSPFITQTLLILIGPPFFSASIYMIFGRMVTRILHNEEFLLLKAKYITKICVVGDVISLFLQAIGGIAISGAEDNIDRFNMGKNIIIGGLVIQILFFGFFVVVETTYYIKLRMNSDSSDYNLYVLNQDIKQFPYRFNNWKSILESLFVCSMFILIRSVYRVIEFTEGNGGYISSHEWFIYVFDGLMMFFCAVLFVSQDVSNYFLKTIPLTLGKH